MLVPFALTPESFSSSSTTTRRVLSIWANTGILYYSPEVIRDLPADVRHTWNRALRANKAIEMDRDELCLGEGFGLEDAPALAGRVRLLAIDRGRSDVFGLTDDVPTRDLPQCDLEASLVDCLDLARTLREAQGMANTPISAETPVEEVWLKRFAPLLWVTSRMTVVDRYAIQRTENLRERSGLCQLLCRMSRGCYPKHMKLLSEGPLRSHTRELIASLTPTNIEIMSVPRWAWSSETTDRWIQAERYVMEIGHGLEILEGERVRRLNTFSFKRISADHEVAARKLEQAARNAPASVAKLKPRDTITR